MHCTALSYHVVDRMSIGTSISTGRVGAGAIAGGVVGALLAVLVLLILVIVTVVIILKYYKNNFKAEEINNQGIATA